MNQDWVRGGIAMLCFAAIGGLVLLGLGGNDGTGIVKAFSIVTAILGLVLIAAGVTDRRPRD